MHKGLIFIKHGFPSSESEYFIVCTPQTGVTPSHFQLPNFLCFSVQYKRITHKSAELHVCTEQNSLH